MADLRSAFLTHSLPQRDRGFLRRMSKLDRSAIVFLIAYLLTREVLLGIPFHRPLSSASLAWLRPPTWLSACFRGCATRPLGPSQPFDCCLYFHCGGSSGASAEHDGHRNVFALSANRRASAAGRFAGPCRTSLPPTRMKSSLPSAQEIQPGQSPTDQALLDAALALRVLIAAAQEQWPGLRVFLHRARLVDPAKRRAICRVSPSSGASLMFAAEQQRGTPSGPVVRAGGCARHSCVAQRAWPRNLGPDPIHFAAAADANSKGLRFGDQREALGTGERIVSSNRTLPPPANWLDIPVNGAATLRLIRWNADPNRVSSDFARSPCRCWRHFPCGPPR